MTGPEHYRRAEELIDSMREALRSVDALPSVADKSGTALAAAPVTANLIAQAQVHATLALAAATVAPRALGPQESWGGHAIDVSPGWQEATS